ncbi:MULTISPECIES: ribokinase [Marivita]|uniref:Ribokinase n=1 Tax=Marivita cryptomonadis TaxID=505252 RepID=A0A9Q2S013_9RHOB|nr:MULTISPECIES: ribokinase [Marivita]MCR9167519.1 ribokinase [Paracoccaceae bacterium]MBM2321901.1 ribokinase [Marivita cryptomonadis]MBM2331472.1 ribokinase [Marivita cryptomonadis]MBM2341058.1 ribokinase [Marivita cryptomonadis]MBM2345720.1 ribokinase [Marivita cryptomonadis]
MAVFNLGSINADLFYQVPHLLAPGETLASTQHSRGLGGKGANMSVAIARAAARAVHIGAVGADGRWAVERLLEYGVDTRNIVELDVPTGHAVIMVDDHGENAILLFPGANRALTEKHIASALMAATEADTFVFQNETSAQIEGATLASAKGMRVVYAAAPFDAQAVEAVLPMLDILVMNAVEAQQLTDALGMTLGALPVRDVIVTLGGEGCRWINTDAGTDQTFPAIPVTPVDTTGAGDTFTGFLVAGLDRGLPMEQAISLGQQAGAIMVTRHGTADVIPDLKDIEDARFS